MFSAFLLTLAMLGADDPAVTTQAASGPQLKVYQAESAKAGKTADAHIRLALWCEAHGLTAERLKHLSLAVLYDPANTLARGLMGLVGYHGKWDRPDVVGRQIQDDPAHQALVREYLDRRARTPDKAEAQMKLAAWCEEKGLKDQATGSLQRGDSAGPVARGGLEASGLQEAGQAVGSSPKRSRPRSRRPRTRRRRTSTGSRNSKNCVTDCASKDAAKRAKAEQGLTEVTDPRAVPMIWALFVRGGERQQMAAVQMLGQIDGPSASNGLAVLAVFSPTADVRRRATVDTERARSARRHRQVDRPHQKAVQVPGAPRERSRIAG